MKADLFVTVFYEVTAPQPCSTDVHLQLYFTLLWVLNVHLSAVHTFPAQVGIGWELSRDLAGQGHIGSSGEWPSRVSWDCKGKIRTCEWGDGKMVHQCFWGLQISVAPPLHDRLLFLSPFISTSSILLCVYLPWYSSWHWYWPEWLKWTLGSFTSMVPSGFLPGISKRKLLLFLVSCSCPCAVTLKSSSLWDFALSCCFQFSCPVKPSFHFIFWEFRCHDKMTVLSTVAYFLSRSGFWKPEFRRDKEYRGRKSHGYASPCLPLIQSEAHCTQFKKDLEKSHDILQEG